MESLETLVKNG